MNDSATTKEQIEYDAKSAYRLYEVGETYERLRFSGLGGRYRRWSELRAVRRALRAVEPGASVLDCPCGIGRWWPVIAERDGKITAADISPGMRQHAAERAARDGLDIPILEADAERLPFEDREFDWVFSFALTKHLPTEVQRRVLREFGRVARRGVISTFGLLTPVSQTVWGFRKLEGSYPLKPQELEAIAGESSLCVDAKWLCTTPIGTERLVRLRKFD